MAHFLALYMKNEFPYYCLLIKMGQRDGEMSVPWLALVLSLVK